MKINNKNKSDSLANTVIKELMGPDPSLYIFQGQIPKTCESKVNSSNILAKLKKNKDSWVCKEALKSGIASYFRIMDSKQKCLLQGTVSELEQGGDMIFNTTNIEAGDYIDLAFSLDFSSNTEEQTMKESFITAEQAREQTKENIKNMFIQQIELGIDRGDTSACVCVPSNDQSVTDSCLAFLIERGFKIKGGGKGRNRDFLVSW